MASFAAARARCLQLSLAAVALAACSEETAGTTTGTTTETTTSTGGTGGGAGGSGATSSQGGTGTSGGAGGASTTSGSGGAGGATTTGGGGTGGACGAFAQRYGSTDAADESGVAGAVVDAAGGVILAGEFAGAIGVGGQTLTSAGARDAFVVKLGPGGAVVWKKRYGATYDDRVKALVAMPDGGAVVVGTFDGVVDFGGTTLTSIAGPDGFMVRLSETGETLSVLQLENADVRAVALDDLGQLLIAGDFKGPTKFGNITLTSPQNDMFVARVGPGGEVLAAKQYASAAKTGAMAIASRAGRTYLTGSFQSTLDFGSGELVSAGSKDVFVARLDDTLSPVFAKRFGDDTSQEARGVTVLSDGSAVIAGAFRGALDLGGTTLVADTQDDAFVARLDENGGLVFGLRFGDAAVQTARTITAMDGDGLLVGGSFGGTMDVGDGPVVSAGGEDAFVTWLDPQGVAVKTMRWGGVADQRVRSVSVDPCGAVVLGGELTGSLPIGDDVLTATGALDVFVARIAP